MKEEFETYADALWWGLVSHRCKTVLVRGLLVAERWRAGRGCAQPGSCLLHSQVRARLPRFQTSSGRLPPLHRCALGTGFSIVFIRNRALTASPMGPHLVSCRLESVEPHKYTQTFECTCRHPSHTRRTYGTKTDTYRRLALPWSIDLSTSHLLRYFKQLWY